MSDGSTSFTHPGDVAYRLALVRLLSSRGLATQAEVSAAMNAAKAGGWLLTHLQSGGVDPERLLSAWSGATGLPAASRDEVRRPSAALSTAIDPALCQRLLVVPCKLVGDSLHLAFAVPLSPELTRGLPKHVAAVGLETDVREGLEALWPGSATKAVAPAPAAPAAAPARSAAQDPDDPLAFIERKPIVHGPKPTFDAGSKPEEPGGSGVYEGKLQKRNTPMVELLLRLRVPILVGVALLAAVAVGYKLIFAPAPVPPPVEVVAPPPPPVAAPSGPVPYTLDAPPAVRAASKAIDTALAAGKVDVACEAFRTWRAAMLVWVEKLRQSPRLGRTMSVLSDQFDRDLSSCATTPIDELRAIWARYQQQLAPDE